MRYLFRRDLLRSTAYDMQLRARLRGLHARAAAAITAVFHAELAPRYADLAYHHRRAEQPVEERHFAALAGRYAADQFANRDAMRHLERALELLDPEDTVNKFELLLVHEQVADTSGDRARQRAQTYLGDPADEFFGQLSRRSDAEPWPPPTTWSRAPPTKDASKP